MAIDLRKAHITFQNLSPQKQRVDITVGEGFGMRVYKSGVKHWTTRYRFPPNTNPKYFVHHPPFPELKASQALDAHRDVQALVRQGKDPSSELKKAREEAARQKTVDDIWEIYLEKNGNPKLRPSTLKDYENRYKKWIKPTFGKKPVISITSSDIEDLIVKIKKNAGGKINSGDRTAKVCMTLIQHIFTQASKAKQIRRNENPAAGLDSTYLEIENSKKGERVLTLEEISQFWKATRKSEENKNFHISITRGLLIAMLTGMRRQEVMLMKKKHLEYSSDGSAIYCIPSSIMKAKKEHKVFLSEFAMDLISPLMKTNSDYVFFSNRSLDDNRRQSHTGKNALNNAIRTMLGLRHKEMVLDIPRFSPHDLRRSFATGLKREFGASNETIHAMIAHTSKSENNIRKTPDIDPRLTETYIQHEEWKLKESLWKKWSDLIEETVSSDTKQLRSPQLTHFINT